MRGLRAHSCLVSVVTDFIAAMLVLIATLVSANAGALDSGALSAIGIVMTLLAAFGTICGAFAVGCAAVLPLGSGLHLSAKERAERLITASIVCAAGAIALFLFFDPEIHFSAIACAINGICFTKVMRWRVKVHRQLAMSEAVEHDVIRIGIVR